MEEERGGEARRGAERGGEEGISGWGRRPDSQPLVLQRGRREIRRSACV